MPPRRRTKPENRALPQRWEWRGNRIYYQIPPALAGHVAFGGRKRCIPLGSTVSEAHKTWSSILSAFDLPAPSDMAALIQQFRESEIPKKRPTTQTGYMRSLAKIEGAFQEFHPSQIKASHAYKYSDRVKGGKHDMRVLSALLSYAVRIGMIDTNPLIGQYKAAGAPQRAYITDDALVAFYTVLPRKWQLYVQLKLETGLRQADMLQLKRSNITDDGLDVVTQKTGKRVIYEWDQELRRVIDEILALPRKVGSLYLFATNKGQSYYDAETGTASGFQSMWQRYKRKAGVTFSEHDIRGKAASDVEREAARAALAHSDARMTDRYRRAPDRVKPLGISSKVNTEKQ